MNISRFVIISVILFRSSAVVFQSSDFDFLLSKGSTANTEPNSRDSLLLRFDPLHGRTIPVNQPTTSFTEPNNKPILGVPIKEEPSDESFVSAASSSMQDNNSPDDQQYCLNNTLPLNTPNDDTPEASAGHVQDPASVFNEASGFATSSQVSNAVSIHVLPMFSLY